MKCLCNKDPKTRRKYPCNDSKLYTAGIELRKLDSWPAIAAASEKFAKLSELKKIDYLFRGQGHCSWGLKTPLERSFEAIDPPGKTRVEIEGGLVRLFKRQFPQFGLPVPADGNYMEWLALMRHHGAPTRLLDWTYTFYAAIFFAIEDLEGPTTESAVWAISTKWLKEQVEKMTSPSPWNLVGTEGSDPNCRTFGTFKKAFLSKLPFVINMNSYGQNERQVIQQGTFLCQGDIDQSFEENLLALADGKPFNGNLIKYVITKDKESRKEILRRLHRMNMNRATLFPGLDGFAQSLKTRMLFPQLLFPDTKWRSWISGK